MVMWCSILVNQYPGLSSGSSLAPNNIHNLKAAMGDIRQSLLPRDVLSAAKELLYHLDIYISNLVQSGRPPPQVDSKTLELVEEFILHSPKDRNVQPRVSQAWVLCI